MRLNILAFAAAVLWLQFQPTLPIFWPWLPLFCAPLLVFAWVLRQRWLGRAALLLACALGGVAWTAFLASGRLAEALPSDWEGRDISVVGVVAELPQSFAQGNRFRFDIESVDTAGAQVPGSVMLSWYQGLRDGENFVAQPVRPGERWRLVVRLKRPHGNANPYAFDYEAWLFERGIRATGYVRPAAPASRLTEMVWSPGYALELARWHLRAVLQQGLPEESHPYVGVLIALTIGDQRAIHGDLWNTFNRTGTTHLMSISGLHVTMLAALLASFVAVLWRRVPQLVLRLPARKAAVLAGAVAALFYVFLAGFAVPAQRTLYMLLVAALALYSGRIVAPSRVLCLALLVVLLIDPWAVLAAGFWLSFTAVAALLFISAARVGEIPGWRGRLAAWGSVQWAATVASLPILLLIFQQFSLVSPLANALAIPVISLLVTPLALLATLLPWWPLLELTHAILAGLMVFLDWCALWPVWQAPAPSLAVVLLAALGVFVLLLPRGLAGRWVGAVLMLPLVFWPAPRPASGEVWIEVLDVGQGLAVVVRTEKHNLLYDTGPLYSAESDAGQRVIVPYLRALGVNQLDALVVTHRDKDHSGGLASVRAALPVTRLLSSLPEIGGELCADGQSWVWEGVQFSVLHPRLVDYAQAGKTNHFSCVLRIAVGDQAVLLTSDIEAADEAAMLQRSGKALQADYLLVPHHGSRTSSTPAFLAAVKPHQALLPVGYRNRYGHPKADILALYQQNGVRIWRTDKDGALLLKLGGAADGMLAWRQLQARYWH